MTFLPKDKGEIFKEFKKRLEDLNLEDVDFLRFLIAREYDIPAAESMIRKMITWRKEHDMDHLLERSPASYLTYDLLFKVVGPDYDGVKMIWIPVGRWKVRKWVEMGKGTDLVDYGRYIIETGKEILYSTSSRKQVTMVVDCDGLSFYEASYIPTLRLLYEVCKDFEQNFPETLRLALIINAPWVFTIAFNFVKIILSERTMSKIKVFGHNQNEWLPALIEVAPQSSCPEEYFHDENQN